jgi:hypothetical protein
MCRNIKMLFNFDPPVTPDEVRAASLQFVRKITGFNKPSKANEAAFQAAIDSIASISTQLLGSLETNAPPKESRRRGSQGQSSQRREISGLGLPTTRLVSFNARNLCPSSRPSRN